MMPGTEPREERIRWRLAAPFGALAPGSGHPEPEILVAHASGELPTEEAIAVTAHLASCDDGSCAALLRDVVAGAAAARDVLYTSRREEVTDPSISAPHRQSTQSFACDEALWETFEAMARDEGCSTDWLLNEAMKAWVQQRPRPIAPRGITLKDAPLEPLRERNTPTLPRAYLPRAPSTSRRAATALPPGSGERLTFFVEGVRYEVNKERFVVGRSAPVTDLALDDPGVSRRHALIERAGGQYFLVDLGSTNGVEYQGERVARKQIAHGDRFRIGDYELEFSFA
jgi:hypothetical protein